MWAGVGLGWEWWAVLSRREGSGAVGVGEAGDLQQLCLLPSLLCLCTFGLACMHSWAWAWGVLTAGQLVSLMSPVSAPPPSKLSPLSPSLLFIFVHGDGSVGFLESG